MRIVGLEKKGEKLYLAAIKKEGKRLSIDFQALQMLDEELESNAFYVTGLQADEVFLKHPHGSVKNKKTFLATLPFQLSSMLPAPLDEGVALPIFTKQMQSAVYFARHETIDRHIASMPTPPDGVSAVPHALYRFVSHFFKEMRHLICLHLDGKHAFILSITDGFLSMLLPLKHSDNEDAFLRECDRAICTAQKARPELKQLLVTGKVKKGMLDKLKRHIGSTCTFVEPDYVGDHEWSLLQEFVIPLGLSLDYQNQNEETVQFRQGKRLHPKTYRRYLKKAGAFSLVALGSIICAFSFLTQYRTQEHDRLAKRLTHLSSQFSTLFDETSQTNSIETTLRKFEKRLVKKRKSGKLYQRAARVTDLLSYLNRHPLLCHASIDLQNVRYQLVEHPSLKKKNTPYRIKVDLAFETKDASLARTLHETLLEGDSLIDAKQPIKWSREKDVYHTTFYIKA